MPSGSAGTKATRAGPWVAAEETMRLHDNARLDTDPELWFLCATMTRLARVRIEVIGRPAVELVALPQLAPDHDAYRQHRDSSGHKAHIAENNAALGGGKVDGILDSVP